MDIDELFITEIKSQPVLYNSRHIAYADQEYRRKVWKEIDKKFGWTNLAKKKWKDLRDRYVKERRRRICENDLNCSSWKLYSQLNFVDDHIRNYSPRVPKIAIRNRNRAKIKGHTTNLLSDNENIPNESGNGIVDPLVFELHPNHKCGKIYIENDNVIIICDFCENIFHELRTFKIHVANYHETEMGNEDRKSIIYAIKDDYEDWNKFENNSVNDDDGDDNDYENSYNEVSLDYNADVDGKNDLILNKCETWDIGENKETQESQISTIKLEVVDASNADDQKEIDDMNDAEFEDDDDDDENVSDTYDAELIPEFESSQSSLEASELKKLLKPTNAEKPSKKINEFGLYECDYCDKTYPKYQTVLDHFRNIHAIVNKCELCGESTNSRSSLITHLKKIHKIYEKKFGNDALYRANLKKIENSETLPLVPPRYLNEEGRYPCIACTNTYTRHDSLRKHYRIEHLSKRERKKCKHCDKTFQTQFLLDIHMSVHNRLRPYKCTKCTSSFIHPKYLAVHLRHHLGNKRYPCEYCQETFAKRIDKVLHQRQNHTKEKPYNCSSCSETFVKYSELIVHKNKIHDKTKPKFQCDRCSKIFSRRDTLLSHLRGHNNERPYQCSCCRTKFISSSALRAHERKFHNQKIISQ